MLKLFIIVFVASFLVGVLQDDPISYRYIFSSENRPNLLKSLCVALVAAFVAAVTQAIIS